MMDALLDYQAASGDLLADVLTEFRYRAIGNDNTSAENRALYLKSAERQREYIQIEGNQLRLQWPFVRQDYEKSFGQNADDAKQIEAFRRCGGKLSFANDEMTLIAGEPTHKITTLTLPVSQKPYVPNALEAVRKRTSVQRPFDADAAAKRFVTLGGDDDKKPEH